MRKTVLLPAALCFLVGICLLAQNLPAQLGRTPTAEELKQQDITVLPDGTGLPRGKGTAAEGETIFRARCAGCHGNGEKSSVSPPLVGGFGTLTSDNPVKTIGSYWPYATTIWDYIHRAMPYNEPGSLSVDEIYALTAFLLYRNNIIARDQVISNETLPKVRMPNRDGFVPDARPDVGKHPAVPRSSSK